MAFAFAVAAPAGADESVPPAAAGDTAPVVTDPPPTPPETPPADQPTSTDPAPPEPPPAPQPEPPAPAPEPPVVEHPAPTPPADHSTPTAPERPSESRDGGSTSAPTLTVPDPVATFTVAPAAETPAAPGDTLSNSTAPLGWDVYDDTLFTGGTGNTGGTGGTGGGLPSIYRAFSPLAANQAAADREEHRDAAPASRADPISSGGPGGGGPGGGQRPSLGLGGTGGGGAGIALLTLLGIASGWFLLTPNQRRSLLASTATWRPSAYVPPIEQPG